MNTEKICLVTGASSGIRFAIAKALHFDHSKVIASAHCKDRLSHLGLYPINILAGGLNFREFQDPNVDNIADAVKFKMEQLYNVRIPKLMILPKDYIFN